VNLDELVGPAAIELSDRLRETSGWEQRFDILERLFLDAWCDEPAPEPRAELSWAWRRLRETAGGVGVQELAREVGWSRRHLSDRFRAEYGLSPKVAARVLRFEQAVSVLKRRPTTRLADLAANLGYADQAHLTREWHSLAGCSPRQWMTEELPIVQDPEPATAAG
jgi:AraC-like DNA-binding protein